MSRHAEYKHTGFQNPHFLLAWAADFPTGLDNFVMLHNMDLGQYYITSNSKIRILESIQRASS